MSFRFTRGHAAATLAALAAAVLAACGGGSGGGSAPTERASAKAAPATPHVRVQAERGARASASRLYIVQMADLPAIAYEGGVPGYAATKPARGQKLDPNSPAVLNYTGYLQGRHADAMARAGVSAKSYSYAYAFNGFAAQLDDAQAAKLAVQPGVLAVVADERRQLVTSSTPSFLGLDATGGVWSKAKGEGVVIGIIDGGIWPEHPSFSDRTDANGNGTKDGKLGYLQLPGWHGKCVPGESFTAANCNQKLIGARYYNAGYGGNDGVREALPYEFLSPRDYDGHGTHTASTAGGNANVKATGEAAVLGSISGIAPRARIAAYKVCWGVGGTANAGCFNSDSVAAIDQAVADGVDVINFSISGTQTNFLDPVEVAFLFAADAGVFVATSAGNSGPTASTVAHPSPWVTTVAAGTHNRDGKGSVTLGNNATYTGASIAQPVGPAPLIAASVAGKAGADPALLSLCFGEADGAAVLDPAKVTGKIVVCDRGVTARVNKSLAVRQAGGVGMILANTSVNSINADLHFVPTVHVQSTDRAAILAYAGTAEANATINASEVVYNAEAPFTASFSSRGPLLAAGGDLLKPDVMAPGQDILAAVSPAGHHGNLFDLLSGTSMSSPHVAGLAALFKEAKPSWSPMAIKSALMTSAYDILDEPVSDADRIFRQGAGHVRPNDALDPGLVLDHSFNHWLAFLCGTTNGVNPASCTALKNAGFSTDPSDMNVASIAIGDMAGKQTVKRRVTHVGSQTETYTPSVVGLGGFSVDAGAPFELKPGQSKALDIKFERNSGALNAYTGGQLVLTGSTGRVVRLPVVVRPVALAAPASVAGDGAPLAYSVTFGYSGPFVTEARGLVAADITSGSIGDDPTNGSCSLSTPAATGFQNFAVTIPAGTTYARFALFDADVAAGSDLDLCVFKGTTLVGSSGSGTSAEEVNLSNPVAGTDYTVVVQGWGVNGNSPYKLHAWILGSTAAGNMAVTAPASATLGASGTVELSFSGLAAQTRYLGAVAYGGDAASASPTIVRIDTP